jgi:alanyl-tRNA synthetase
VLGNHVAQKGSLVQEENLRFDFSHFAKMTDEEIAKVEQIVNAKIRENVPVVIKEMSKDDAVAMGAMALFGEKYGDVVRVVVMDEHFSIELCGGTHVGNTGELGLFKITAETATAAGVRRVEAVCGTAAEQYINQQLNELDGVKALLKNPKELNKAIEKLMAENAALEKRIESMEARQLVEVRNQLLQKVTVVNGVNFIGANVPVSNGDALKKICFDLKNELDNYLVVLTANIDGKPSVAVMVEEALSNAKGLEAQKIIKEKIAGIIKGGGGGQKTLATAGGQDASNLDKVVEAVKAVL